MPVHIHKSGGMSIVGKPAIALYRLLTLRSGLNLESKGLRLSRGPSCLTIVKRELGFKGNRDAVAKQLDDYITALKGSVEVTKEGDDAAQA